MREHSGEFLCLRWVWADEGIGPYELFSGLSEEPGDCDRRESLERAAPVCATLRYDCHRQSLLF